MKGGGSLINEPEIPNKMGIGQLQLQEVKVLLSSDFFKFGMYLQHRL